MTIEIVNYCVDFERRNNNYYLVIRAKENRRKEFAEIEKYVTYQMLRHIVPSYLFVL